MSPCPPPVAGLPARPAISAWPDVTDLYRRFDALVYAVLEDLRAFDDTGGDGAEDDQYLVRFQIGRAHV